MTAAPPNPMPAAPRGPRPQSPARMPPVAVRAFTASCAAGVGLDALAAALRSGHSGLAPDDDPRLPCWLGRVGAWDNALGSAAAGRPADLAQAPGRAARLALGALQPDGFAAAVAAACRRHGAARVGLVLGTSASTIGLSEEAYRSPDSDGGFPAALRNPALHTPHALGLVVHRALGLQGPSITVSTACSSSAKAFASAERWLRLGLVDAVVVAGVEALCDSLRFGFRALGLVDAQACRPFDAERRGISIGEAAAFALLERGPGPLSLLGYGEAGDAHHMSSPHPEGLGAEEALDAALARAGLQPGDVDFVNLHGTGTPANDRIEAALVARRYAPGVFASATKGLTGHTMGAAGALEAVICLLALQGRGRPGSANTRQPDPAFGERFAQQLRLAPDAGTARIAASHSFGFGGSNAVLVFGEAA